MIVVFDDVTPPQYLESGEKTSASPSDSEQRIIELEQELAYTKENLLSAIEELETANEQFQLTNEELQSTNEELQSTNLELELSKEQLQSLNEELKSINKELQGKVFELSDINNDMKNLLDSTHIATIFVDKNLCIKRFTPEATKIINLIKTDLGRPLNHLVSNLIYKNLIEDVKNVLNTLINHEAEVQTKDGRWYLIRISPYRTVDDIIGGAVINFVDIHERKQMEEESLRESEETARARLAEIEATYHHAPIGLCVLDTELRYVRINKRLADINGIPAADHIGKTVREIVPHLADDAELLLRQVL